MEGNLERLTEESSEAVQEGEGQAKFLKKPEDLLAMVKKLQEEGTLEPQIEDLIHQINELQQAKKKSVEELGEAQAVWQALNRELDSLHGEEVHLEEVLSKKQEALMILQQHSQAPESEAEASRLRPPSGQDLMAGAVAEAPERVPAPEPSFLMAAQPKDLWEFRVLELRLAREIRALQRSREQLRAEGTQVRARLQEVGRRLHPAPEVGDAPAMMIGRLKAELPSSEGPVHREARNADGDLEPQAELAPSPP